MKEEIEERNTREESQPNYYAVIPASVRYDKDLTDKAKLLYGEISALTNKHGYCFATNQYFTELYDCTDRTIQNCLNQLSKKGYIKIVLEKNTVRKIYITTPEKNFMGTPEKNFTHNNIKSNRKIDYNYYNIKELEKIFEKIGIQIHELMSEEQKEKFNLFQDVIRRMNQHEVYCKFINSIQFEDILKAYNKLQKYNVANKVEYMTETLIDLLMKKIEYT